VRREAVLAALTALDVEIPHAPLPPRPPPPGKRVYVPYGALMTIVHALGERRPSSARVGFNREDELRAWVIANAEVDTDVLEELGIEPVPQPG
jgi:hypothetical protein